MESEPRWNVTPTSLLLCSLPNLLALGVAVEEACLLGRVVGLAGNARESGSHKHSVAAVRHIREGASVHHDHTDLVFGRLAVGQTYGQESRLQEDAPGSFPSPHRKGSFHRLLGHALLMLHVRVEP